MLETWNGQNVAIKIDWIVDGIIIERASFPSISLSFFFFFVISLSFLRLTKRIIILDEPKYSRALTRTSIYTSDDVCFESFYFSRLAS